jgi:hypothetical protein
VNIAFLTAPTIGGRGRTFSGQKINAPFEIAITGACCTRLGRH